MKGVQLSHYNVIMNAIILRISMPARVNSTVREVFFAPCKLINLLFSSFHFDMLTILQLLQIVIYMALLYRW